MTRDRGHDPGIAIGAALRFSDAPLELSTGFGEIVATAYADTQTLDAWSPARDRANRFLQLAVHDTASGLRASTNARVVRALTALLRGQTAPRTPMVFGLLTLFGSGYRSGAPDSEAIIDQVCRLLSTEELWTAVGTCELPVRARLFTELRTPRRMGELSPDQIQHVLSRYADAAMPAGNRWRDDEIRATTLLTHLTNATGTVVDRQRWLLDLMVLVGGPIDRRGWSTLAPRQAAPTPTGATAARAASASSSASAAPGRTESGRDGKHGATQARGPWHPPVKRPDKDAEPIHVHLRPIPPLSAQKPETQAPPDASDFATSAAATSEVEAPSD